MNPLDFIISFNENLSFTITDNSDYSSLAEDKTDLEIIYPPITGVDLISLDLYNENVATAGDDFIYVVEDEESLTGLVDGVYKFRLVVLNSASEEIGELTKYYVQDYNIQSCLRSLIDSEIDNQCGDNWCKIGFINASLATAKLRAADGYYTEAQEIMDYLKNNICNGC